jgi:hypothetical protein
MSQYRGPNPWGGVAEDPYSASEVVGQGDKDGPVQTVKVDFGGNNPDAVDPDETNAVRTASEIDADKDKQQGTDNLVVEDDAVDRGAVTITNTTPDEAKDVQVVDEVSATSTPSSQNSTNPTTTQKDRNTSSNTSQKEKNTSNTTSEDNDISPDSGPSNDPQTGNMGLSDQDIMDLPDDLRDSRGLIVGAAALAVIILTGGS